MPTRAPRLCRCGRVVPAGDRCECQRIRDAASRRTYDAKRPNASARGYDSEWQRAAKAFLSLPQNRRCECGNPATLVRHRISITKRPDLRMASSNWLPGCARCNARDREREKRER